MKIALIPITDFSPDMVRALFLNFQLLENALQARLRGDDNIEDGSILTADLADLSVTVAKLAGSIPYTKTDGSIAGIARGRYTGDGTANREINIGWTPKYVKVIRLDDSKIFESIDDGTAVSSWWRDSAGALGTGLADWQGISVNGFKGGTGGTGGTSNASGINYGYVAWR